jgi:hypothetical protein
MEKAMHLETCLSKIGDNSFGLLTIHSMNYLLKVQILMPTDKMKDRIIKIRLRRSKMISNVTSATQTLPVDKSQFTPVDQKSTQSKPQAIPTDTVQLSSTAKAALQEAMETAAETSKEANKGDVQAQRRVAREAAAKKLLE